MSTDIHSARSFKKLGCLVQPWRPRAYCRLHCCSAPMSTVASACSSLSCRARPLRSECAAAATPVSTSTSTRSSVLLLRIHCRCCYAHIDVYGVSLMPLSCSGRTTALTSTIGPLPSCSGCAAAVLLVLILMSACLMLSHWRFYAFLSIFYPVAQNVRSWPTPIAVHVRSLTTILLLKICCRSMHASMPACSHSSYCSRRPASAAPTRPHLPRKLCFRYTLSLYLLALGVIHWCPRQ